MKNVYCISGLGADERIFSKLSIRNCNLIHVKWPNFHQDDNMSSYSQKVSALIPEDNPIILGVSFGGMIATEIGKVRDTAKIILVSSAKDRYEKPQLPFILKKIIYSGTIPSYFYKMPNPVLYYLFGVESKNDRIILRDILRDTNSKLAKWSVSSIVKWDNIEVPNNVVHIHGKRDRLILPENIHADEWVEDGGHMMIYNRADIVSRFVEKQIENL